MKRYYESEEGDDEEGQKASKRIEKQKMCLLYFFL